MSSELATMAELVVIPRASASHALGAVIGVTMLHETVPTDGVLEWIAVVVSVVAMVASTVWLSRSAARHDMIHEHELADVITRTDRGD